MCVGLSDDRPGEPITPQIAHICALSGLGKLSSLTVNCVFGHLEISPRVLCKMLLRFCFCGKASAQAMEHLKDSLGFAQWFVQYGCWESPASGK